MILDTNGAPIGSTPEPAKQVEIVRSFSFKKNLGNYQSCDLFCSQKAQVNLDEVDAASADLHEWCFDQVMAAVKEIERMQSEKAARIEAKRSAA